MQGSHTFFQTSFYVFSIPFQYQIEKVQYHYVSSFFEFFNHETQFCTLHKMKCFAFNKIPLDTSDLFSI